MFHAQAYPLLCLEEWKLGSQNTVEGAGHVSDQHLTSKRSSNNPISPLAITTPLLGGETNNSNVNVVSCRVV